MVKQTVFTTLLLWSIPALALDTKLGNVDDSRTTGRSFAHLRVDVEVSGQEMNDAKRFRLKPSSAIDDTGLNLIDKESAREIDFEEIERDSTEPKKVTLEFKNPARKAITIKELKGKVELYIPKYDPSAIAIFDNLKAVYGKPLPSTVFKQSGIELIVSDSATVAATQKKENDTAIAKARAEGSTEEQIKMMESFMALSGITETDDKGLTFRITDPNNKIIDIEVRKGNGEKLHRVGTMTSDSIKTMEFDDSIPADAKLVVYVGTAKSLVVKEFAFNNVVLP